MDLAALGSRLGASPATGGWDAICAINAESLNGLFREWFMTSDPGGPSQHVQLATLYGLPSDLTWALLDVWLGPPEISFPPFGRPLSANVSMLVASGSLLVFDRLTGNLRSAMTLQPDVASISASIDLTRTTGQAALGNLTLQFGTGDYSPAITGIDPTSLMGVELSRSLQSWFSANNVTVDLGGITTSSVPPGLQPTSFQFVSQPNPEAPNDGCVLLLIQTNGSGGQVAPLQTYPIPDGRTAALLIANQVLFNQLLPNQLSPYAPRGCSFTGQLSGDTYHAGMTGTYVIGELSNAQAPLKPYSSTGQRESGSLVYQPAAITIDMTSLSLDPTQGGLSLTYAYGWNQPWAYDWEVAGITVPGCCCGSAGMALQVQATAPVVISDPKSCVVTFSFNTQANCSTQPDQNLVEAFDGYDPSADMGSIIAYGMEFLFDFIRIEGLPVFALENLLFYPNQTMTLSNGCVPCDLLLVGDVLPVLSVAPAITTLAPGGPALQFTATYLGQATPPTVVWEIEPSQNWGSIDSSTGVYTPPATIERSRVVNVTATTGNDAASAIILLYSPQPASQHVVVGPPMLTVVGGKSSLVTATDRSGKDLDVEWTLDPPSPTGGTVSMSDEGWIYTAPTDVSIVSSVKLTAANSENRAETGTIPLTLVAAESTVIEISPSSPTVAVNGCVQFTATPSDPEVVSVNWVVYTESPMDNFAAGSIEGDGLTVTYHAPAQGGGLDVCVAAYAFGTASSAPALGVAHVTVTS